jgi:hypothetical protein
MPKINKLLEHFKEAQLYNTIRGELLKADDLKDIWVGDPILLHFNQLDEEGILVSIKETPIRIKIDIDDTKKISPQLSLLWLTQYSPNEQTVQLVYLNAHNVTSLAKPLDIAYTETFLNKQDEGFDPLKWVSDIEGSCIFTNKYDSYQYFCVEECGRSSSSFWLRGLNRTLEIKKEDGKWIIKTDIKSKRFPRKISNISNFSIYRSPKVSFVEKTKAGEALLITQEKALQGATIMSLWEKYTDLEVSKAMDFQSQFGIISFRFLKHLPNNLTRVKLMLTDSQRERLYAEKEKLSNMALELSSVKQEVFGGRNRSFKIYRFLKDYEVELIDEDYEIKKDGSFLISIAGDETIMKRRNYAFKLLMSPPTTVVRSLLFAIEGLDALEKVVRHHHQALTKRTREFLERNFGISDLNENQKEAIEIALNTPDIVVIQGPPGTGKSTVIAAICDRIQEIAEKEGIDSEKLILVSAFQNDTVEHISSKIKTMGLPTIKVGKDSVGTTAENEFVLQCSSYLRGRLDELADILEQNVLKSINYIIEIFHGENNINNIVGLINNLLDKLSPDLQSEWNDHFTSVLSEPSSKLERRLHALITDPEQFFNEGGPSSIRRLLICKEFHPSDEERKWLDLDTPLSPEDTPDGYFERLKAFKDKYLEPYTKVLDSSEDDLLFVESWLQRAKLFCEENEKRLTSDKKFFIGRVLSDINSELISSPKYIRRSIQAYAESLAATNQVAGGKELGKFCQVQNVILEEAARSNPLDLLIPMVKATKRIILVGDHKQLPHLLEDDIAEKLISTAENVEKQVETREVLKESLFGRIFDNLKNCHPKRIITLSEQFRMHPVIGNFISRVYYDGVLSSKEGMEMTKKHGLSLPWAKDKVAIFADVSRAIYGPEKSGKSKSRKAEAIRIMGLIKEILADPKSNDLSIGVITFYSSQVTTICEEAVKNNFMERTNTGDYRVTNQYQYTDDGREKFRVGSVDSFQGKEFDIVILSTVRSNDHDHFDTRKAYGFLSLTNRLNVAFSRAQKLLIVVGDGSMFNDEGAKDSVEGLYEFYTNLSTDVNYGSRI